MVLTIYGHDGHLDQWTSIILVNFHFHVPKAYIQNLVKNGPVVSEKPVLIFISK